MLQRYSERAICDHQQMIIMEKEAFVKDDFLVHLGREFTMGMGGFILKKHYNMTRGVSVVDGNGFIQVHETTGIEMGEDGQIKCDESTGMDQSEDVLLYIFSSCRRFQRFPWELI